MNHLVFIVFDSARYDAVKNARAPFIKKLSKLKRRYSYASWTAPSHTSLLMGQVPHDNKPLGQFTFQEHTEYYLRWSGRLDLEVSFSKFLPEISLPAMLKRHGYETHAMVSMPVLNPSVGFSRFFDHYELMKERNQFHKMVDAVSFKSKKPKFYFFNVGETHYPYELPGEETKLPWLPGVHGTLKRLGEKKAFESESFFTRKKIKAMKEKQIHCVEYLDTQIARLYEKCPENTHFIITSDHGELFGEDGFFGHGPVIHEKVFEVPFLEGRLPT